MKKHSIFFICMVVLLISGCSASVKKIDTNDLTISQYAGVEVDTTLLEATHSDDSSSIGVDHMDQIVSDATSTVIDYGTDTKKSMGDAEMKQYEETMEDIIAQAAWDIVVANTDIKAYPTDALHDETDHLQQIYKDRAAAYNLTYDEYVTKYLKTDVETMQKQIEDQAKQNVRDDLIIDAIVDAEGLTISKSNIYDYFERQADLLGFSSVDNMLKKLDERLLTRAAKREVVQTWLGEHCKEVS